MNPILLASCRLRSGLRATAAPPCFNARSGGVAFTHRSEPRSNTVLEKQIPNSEYGSPLQRTARATPRVVEFAITRHACSTPHAAYGINPCMSLSIFLVLRQPNGKMGRRSPGRGSGGGAGVIDLPSDLLSPRPSLIHSRFCVQNSNRCLSGHASARPARIRKNESEHNRTYD